MIKTELICSKEYARELNPFFNENDWENLVLNSQRFEPIYSKNIPEVLGNIPDFTGYRWKKDLYIPIYLVNYSGPSRTNPLTIKVDSNDNMLVKLIHELSHVNFPNHFYFNKDFYEDLINQVTENVADNLSITNCGALRKILNYREKLVMEGISLEKIPFNSTNLKDYFGLKSSF